MSQWYEIWGAPDHTSIGLIATKTWKEHHRRVLHEMGDEYIGCLRASSWKRAKARYRKWKRLNGWNHD